MVQKSRLASAPRARSSAKRASRQGSVASPSSSARAEQFRTGLPAREATFLRCTARSPNAASVLP